MRLTVLAIDKLRYRPWREAADEYLGRLERYGSVEERELKPTQGRRRKDQRRSDESTRLLEAAPQGAWLIALDERGKQMKSRSLARRIQRERSVGRTICCLVGGALGHDPSLRQRADFVLGLSKLTLPHELARVVLYEQLYRAMTIIRGEPYHK